MTDNKQDASEDYVDGANAILENSLAHLARLWFRIHGATDGQAAGMSDIIFNVLSNVEREGARDDD